MVHEERFDLSVPTSITQQKENKADFYWLMAWYKLSSFEVYVRLGIFLQNRPVSFTIEHLVQNIHLTFHKPLIFLCKFSAAS